MRVFDSAPAKLGRSALIGAGLAESLPIPQHEPLRHVVQFRFCFLDASYSIMPDRSVSALMCL